MKENKSMISNKRTSLVPMIRNKKNKKNAKDSSLDYIGTNIQDKNNDKYKDSWNKDVNNYDDMELLDKNILKDESKNNILEKVTIKNTTTKSVETRTPDGYYTNATQSDERVEEYTRYESSNQAKKNLYDEVIDIYPSRDSRESLYENDYKQNQNNKKLAQYDNANMIDKSDDVYLLEDMSKQTMDRCMEAVKENGLALRFIEPKFRNKMIEFLAVKENGLSIQYIDEKSKSESVCIEAVKQNGLALQYIDNQNERICIEAINQNINAYRYVNIDSYKVNLKALRQDGLILRYIKNQSDELCFAAVAQNGLALKYVNEQKVDICKEAIRENWAAFHYVLDKNYEVCIEAVKENGLLLEYIKNQDERICKEAIEQNPYAIEFVLDQTNEICRRALYKSGLSLKYVINKTPELCILALSRNSLSIKYIPIEILKEGLDLKDYVFISSKKHILVNSIKEVRGLNQINLYPDKEGYLIINALGKSKYPTSFVLQKDGLYIDDDLIMDIASKNHFVALINE